MTGKLKRERGPVCAPLLHAFTLLFSNDLFYLRACNDGRGYTLRETSHLFLFPAQVAKDMRHAKHEDGERRFTVDEFLMPQQTKSYFSRVEAKLQQGSREDADADECDFQTIEEQEAY